MKLQLFFACLFITGTSLFSQINMADSSVQVIAYWTKGDKQNYTITSTKTKIKGKDTTSKEKITYELEIVVKNATDKSYTIEWHYKNISSNTSNASLKKLYSMTKNLRVQLKTNELGVLQEVVNWKEIRDYIKKSIALLSDDFKDKPEMQKILKQMEGIYSSKEAIEAAAIKDVQQFHNFHGAKYKLSEVLRGKLKVPNLLGGPAFDADMTVVLDEINKEDNTYLMRSTQLVDKEQLIDATFNYLKKMYESMKLTPPNRADMEDLKNETITASRIHGTGWVVYSIETTTVSAQDVINTDERIIELK